VQLPNGTAILQEAADALLEHFPSDPSLLLHVIHCLLDHSPDKVGNELACCVQKNSFAKA
jgi:hypothetical protein